MGSACGLEYLPVSRVYVIVVNWNGWQDTIECLESVFRSDYNDFRVIVCDNGSSDGSVERITSWAENRLDIITEEGCRLRDRSFPPVGKPISYATYSQAEAESGGCLDDDPRLILIRNPANLGFAGGNNAALLYALARDDFDNVWLLNNDTVVNNDALSKMVLRMKQKSTAGMCGSTILHYGDPKRVQALGGGYYCKWLALSWHQGRLKKSDDAINALKAEKWMNYVVGASMLVSKKFLQDIGLMFEDYFLYFEEIDWALRARGRFSLVYEKESIVYHKIGKSIGTSSDPRKKSIVCDYYNLRNRILFTRRFFPAALPTVYLTLFGELIIRLLLGKWDRFVLILKLLFQQRVEIPQS